MDGWFRGGGTLAMVGVGRAFSRLGGAGGQHVAAGGLAGLICMRRLQRPPSGRAPHLQARLQVGGHLREWHALRLALLVHLGLHDGLRGRGRAVRCSGTFVRQGRASECPAAAASRRRHRRMHGRQPCPHHNEAPPSWTYHCNLELAARASAQSAELAHKDGALPAKRGGGGQGPRPQGVAHAAACYRAAWEGALRRGHGHGGEAECGLRRGCCRARQRVSKGP